MHTLTLITVAIVIFVALPIMAGRMIAAGGSAR